VRGVDGQEVHLASYDTFAQVDLLAEHTVAAMLAGLSTRRYGTALEPVGAAVEEQACARSRSAVSRRFRAATADRLAAFRTADLTDRDWLVCFVDGYDFAGHPMVGALGVTSDGTKVPLGVVEGSTENATVVRGLVSDLRDRGLTAEDGILFVLDGGKALRRAVTDVYGDRALVQRCRIHKERNILDHLPSREHAWVRAKLHRAWDARTLTPARLRGFSGSAGTLTSSSRSLLEPRPAPPLRLGALGGRRVRRCGGRAAQARERGPGPVHIRAPAAECRGRDPEGPSTTPGVYPLCTRPLWRTAELRRCRSLELRPTRTCWVPPPRSSVGCPRRPAAARPSPRRRPARP